MSTSHDETTELPQIKDTRSQADGVEETTTSKEAAWEEAEKAIEQKEEAPAVAEQKDVPTIKVRENEQAKVESEDEVDAIAGEGTATPAEPAGADTGDVPKEGGGDGDGDGDKLLEAQSTGTRDAESAIPAGITSSLARPPTPSSRTSTPPLNSSASGAKKFSSVNVNKKFLSKTVAPAAGSPAGGAKLGLSSTSPVPISTTSRLLSTKLTTVPSKTSQSPLPPTSATSTPSSSPWAKPAPIEPESSIKAPTATKARVLSSIQPVTMGSGQGIAVPKAAWRPVTQEGGKRGVGLTRDFPTAKEVADGKRDAAAIAQAKAAHNQAIMQELNAFTQLDPNARHWEDDDDDDEVIDFGDGIVYPHHDHSSTRTEDETPVTKSERFVEDFDRSWPRQRPVQLDETSSSGMPRRTETDRDRVLFNANSNRLEPPGSRQQVPPMPQPTRLMSRPDAARSSTLDRSLPPHLQGGDGGRALPPHMLHAPAPAGANPPTSTRPLAQPTRPAQQAPATGRQPWGAQRDDSRPLPPHLQPTASSERRELPPQSTAFNTSQPARPPIPQSGDTQRRSFSQIQRPPLPNQTASTSPQVPAALPATSPSAQGGSLPPKVDDQTAEMHSAAEKARLRRLAEEQERDAAAERARRKAKELEERLGLKSAAAAAAVAAVAPAVAPVAPTDTSTSTPRAPGPGFTLAQRPQTNAQQTTERAGSSGLPARPAETRTAGREAEGSWRSRVELPSAEAQTAIEAATPSRAAPGRDSNILKGSSAPATSRAGQNLPPAPSRDLPPHAMPPVVTQQPAALPSPQLDVPADIADALLPSAERPQKREQTFDNMLARIQAAMKEARTTPTALEEIEAIVAEVTPLSEVAPAIAAASVKPAQQLAPPPAPRIILPEPSVTQTEIPKSPPPAWRTFAVRIPKSDQTPRPALPLPRIRAFENYRAVNPKGWLMSFDPPIEGLSSTNLSRSEHFLPAVRTKRFGKAMEVSPMVSISPRTLEPYVKKDKKKSDAEKDLPAGSQATAPVNAPASAHLGGNGVSTVDALLGGETTVSAPGEALRRSQAVQEAASTQKTSPVSGRTFPRSVAPAARTPAVPLTTQPMSSGVQSNRWSSEKLDAIAQPIPKPPASVQALEAARKPKSPVKQSLAAKAEKDGLFADDGVGIGNPAQRERALSDAKPGQGGVRFMVSSELEGDSLLDEVNKISLEMVGEGVDGRERSEGKSGADAPGTPAKAANSTRTGTSPTSASTWSNGPVRSTPHGSQHDLMKSMWEQTPAGGSTKESSARADQYISPLVPSTSNTDIATPMYPSLNAPSSTDTSAQSQALSSVMKMPYASSQQAFSPTGGAQQQPYARSPQYPGTSGTYSPDPHSMYGRSTPGSVNGIMANTNGAQAYGMHQQHQQQQIPQAVWSPSAFGAGYGYTNKSTPPVSDKAAAAMAFASASPVGGGADYRYGVQQGQGAGAYGYGHGHQHAAHGSHGHQAHAGQNQAYGAGAYGRQQVTSPVGHGYGYYGGAGGASGQAGRGGRFGAGGAAGGGSAGSAAAAAIAAGAGAVNGEHGYGYGALEGGYYGGVGGGAGGAGASGHQYGYAQGGHGAIGSQQQQQLLLQQQQQHLQAQQARAAAAAAASGGALSAQQRKMWG